MFSATTIKSEATVLCTMALIGDVINSTNVKNLTQDQKNLFSSKEYWHKFTIENGATFEKEDVLHAILDSINPLDLVPVKYTIDGKDSYFLARNCAPAIEKFCLNLLAPINIGNNSNKVNLIIETCHTSVDAYKVNMQYHLKKAIEKRYDKSTEGYVDLTSFHKEPDLYDVLFCPLSRSRFLLYVLSFLKRIAIVTSINLSNNSIEDLKPLEVLREFEDLNCLNLSNNKISDEKYIKLIGEVSPTLTEISLHKNPICEKFHSELEYTKWIINNIPSIKIIDGVPLNFGIPNQQIWLCQNESSFLVNKFIIHYFTLYDKDRKTLELTYDKSALFSMTFDHLPPQNFKDSQLDCYINQCKTLLKVNDENKIMGATHFKNDKIIESLCKLPITKHDLHSFKVDVLHFEETFLVLVVSGIYQEFQNVPKCRHFHRTFAIKKVAKNEYKIANDLYHVTDATEEEIKNSFLCDVYHLNKISERYVNEEEEENMIKVISRLTEMNHAYSKRCLQDCEWNVRKALEVFIENYKNFSIPPEAFGD